MHNEFQMGTLEVRESDCQSLKLFRRTIIRILPKTMRMGRRTDVENSSMHSHQNIVD